MWKNGIHWLMHDGVDCFVEMVNNSKGMIIIAKSKEEQKYVCTEMLFKIVKELQEAKEEFCGTITLQEYMMNSDDPASFNNEDKLYFISEIKDVLRSGKPSVISVSGRGYLDATKVEHLKHFLLSKFIIINFFLSYSYMQWAVAEVSRPYNITIIISVCSNLLHSNYAGAESTQDKQVTGQQIEVRRTRFKDKDHSRLLEMLNIHSARWKEIGSYLGFLPSELENIEARPLLQATAPRSFLQTMLAEWLQWAPEDYRGSTDFATLESLREALNKAGLGETAHSIMSLPLD